MNPIGDNMEKLEMDFRLEDMLEISEELSEASKRIKIIVKNLANFARLDEAERKTVDIHEGIDATLSLLHHELKYQVDVTKEYGVLPQITCHPNELNQVFMNVIMNAIQALELNKLQQEKRRGRIWIKTYQEGQWGVIAITDDGKALVSTLTSIPLPSPVDAYKETEGHFFCDNTARIYRYVSLSSSDWLVNPDLYSILRTPLMSCEKSESSP